MPDSGLVTFGPFTLSPSARLLLRDGEPVVLGSRPLDLLISLVERAGEVVSHQELLSRAWPGLTVDPVNLRVSIAHLRHVLGDRARGERYVATVPGRGYCFVAPVAGDASPARVTAVGALQAGAGNPPPQIPHVVGREADIVELCRLLALQRFISVVGSGGLGKTTVALAMAHAASDGFEAIFFVELGVLAEPALVAATVASAVGVAIKTEDPVPDLLALIAGRRVLIVLDSCEHIIDAAGEIAERIFLGTPLAHLVVTSREALRVEGEFVYLLQPLAAPLDDPDLSAAEAMAAPAVRLCMERAVASGRQSPLRDEEARLVADICRRLDGVPLALELAGGQIATYGVRGAAELLDSQLQLSWRGRRSALPRHQTLQRMLDWSYDLLSQEERATLTRLSIFVGSFTLDAARAIASSGDADPLTAAAAILNLVDKSLLSASVVGEAAQLRLMDTTRAYAATKLAGDGEADRLAARHARYYAAALEKARIAHEAGADPDRPPGTIDNVRAALNWCFTPSGDPGTGARLAANAARLFLDRSLLTECRHWCDCALKTSPEDGLLHLDLREALAISGLYTLGNSTEVRNAIEEALQLARSLGLRGRELNLLTGLHMFLGLNGDFGAAVEVAERGMSIASKVGGPDGVAMAQWMRGSACHFLGDQAGALRHFGKETGLWATATVTSYRFFGYDHRIRSLGLLARTLWLTGSPDSAARVGLQAMEEAERLADPFGICVATNMAATVLLWRGDLASAETRLRFAYRSAERYSLGPSAANTLALLGELAIRNGDPRTGVRMLREAIASMHRMRTYTLLTRCDLSLAEGLLECGDDAGAAEAIASGLSRAEAQGGSCDLPELMRQQAEIGLARRLLDTREAEAALQQAIELARTQQAPSLELRAASSLARLHAREHRDGDAYDALIDVYGGFTEGLDTADLRTARELLASLHAERAS